MPLRSPKVSRSNIQHPKNLTKHPWKLRSETWHEIHALSENPGHFHVYIGHSERTCRVEHKDLDATHFQDSSPVLVGRTHVFLLFFWVFLRLEALNGFHFKTCVNQTHIYGDIIYLQQLQTLGLRNSYQCFGTQVLLRSSHQKSKISRHKYQPFRRSDILIPQW